MHLVVRVDGLDYFLLIRIPRVFSVKLRNLIPIILIFMEPMFNVATFLCPFSWTWVFSPVVLVDDLRILCTFAFGYFLYTCVLSLGYFLEMSLYLA